MIKQLKNGFISGLGFLSVLLIGGITYAATVSDGDILTAELFNQSMVPTGAVMAFYGEYCPDGWNKADGSGDEIMVDGTIGNLDLRGEFVRGLDDGRGIDSSRELASWQKPSIFTYHSDGNPSLYLTSPKDVGDDSYETYGVEKPSLNGYSSATLTRTEISAPSSYVSNGEPIVDFYYKAIRTRNIALLYCIKN